MCKDKVSPGTLDRVRRLTGSSKAIMNLVNTMGPSVCKACIDILYLSPQDLEKVTPIPHLLHKLRDFSGQISSLYYWPNYPKSRRMCPQLLFTPPSLRQKILKDCCTQCLKDKRYCERYPERCQTSSLCGKCNDHFLICSTKGRS